MWHIGTCDMCGNQGYVIYRALLERDVCLSCWHKAGNMKTLAKVTKAGDSYFKEGEIVPIGDFALMVMAMLEEGREHPVAVPVLD